MPHRGRGGIEPLPSGGLRVRVYVGIDPVTKKRLYLDETIPAGPRAQREAEKARTRLLSLRDEKRAPRSRATVAQLLDKYMSVVKIEPTTRKSYEGYIRNYIRPVLGGTQLAKLESESIDAFYAQLLSCRTRCGGRSRELEHRTAGAHECDERCRPHQCRPLASSTVRQMDAILSGACARAVKWKWISVNPVDSATPPPAPPPNPQPPTVEQAARICTEAWRDPDWGMFVWLAMMTGARRGELCALAWDRIDWTRRILTVRTSIAQDGKSTHEKDVKTHQQRRVSLDGPTIEMLRLFHAQREKQAAALGLELPEDARLFSPDPDGARWPIPESISQRYERMCRRLGLDFTLKELRHYSATELIAAGVDLRTVAGRLGHSGGGVTTLRVYTAFSPEADARAATTLGARLPVPPGLAPVPMEDVRAEPDVPLGPASAATPSEPRSPYQRIAADLRGAIACGVLSAGDPLPTVKALAAKYGVSVGTAQRAVTLLSSTGDVHIQSGRRSVVSGLPPAWTTDAS
jgi:integrase